MGLAAFAVLALAPGAAQACITDADCDDANLCTADVCATPNGLNDAVGCTNAPELDGSSCADGDLCNGDETCQAGACTAGAPLVCDNGLFCDGTETCDAALGCQAGTPPVVDDGVGCTTDSCDEVADAVVNAPNDGLCDNGLFCDGAETCDATLDCQAGTPPVVDDGVGCTTDSCDEAADAVVNAPNDGLCDNGFFCDGSETCDAVLDCQAGVAPGDDGVGCTVDICDESTDTVTNTPNNGACDNGLFCDGAETCDAVLDCQAGTAPVVDDGIACTVDSCDEVNDTALNTPDDTACDNGLFCDGAEVCNALLGCQAGTPPLANDGVACTDDSCDEVGDVIVNSPNDGLCSNGLFCDGVETCDAAAGCLGGVSPTNDGIGCTVDTCDEINDVVLNTPNDGACDNGLFCDGAETCDPVLDCQAGAAPVVDDGVACTNDVCDELADVVTNTADDANCDNGLFCDGAETCDPVLDCQAGVAPVVDDGVGCTNDVCDEVVDVVTNTADDANCDNGLFCDGAETCDPVLDCQVGTAPVVDDGVACTNDSCDETADVVLNAPDDTACDNGLFCDGAETCDAALGCQAGADPVDDGIACTDDSCDEAADLVVNAPNDGNCDNGLFCDGAETCDPALDCQAGAAPTIDDGVGCTVDVCDEANDVVTNTADDSACDNGLFCDGAETCDPVLDCQAGVSAINDDGVGCTVDTCDDVTDTVANTPDDTLCDNGLFCDGTETCDAVLDCQAGAAPVIDDGIACTIDACDDINDVVTNTADDGFCDNGLFCDGAETCDAAVGCRVGVSPIVNDGVPCTADTCDEATDTVANTPLDSLCDNGLFCDGAETCDPVLNCQAGTPPVVDDGDSCTADSCDEANDVVVNADNPSTWYADADLDTYGDPASAVVACVGPPSYILQGGDCDDSDPNVSPAEMELCNGRDDNCDGGLAGVEFDFDQDGYVICAIDPGGWIGPTPPTGGGDCDDASDAAFPGAAEICDEIDNDCNGAVDDGLVLACVIEPQTDAQQRCVNQMNRRSHQVGRAQGKATYRCMRSAADNDIDELGNPGQTQDAQSCLVNDVDQRVFERLGRMSVDEMKLCLDTPEQLPSWAYVGGSNSSAAVIQAELGLVADLYGPSLNGVLVAKGRRSRCQADTWKRADHLFGVLWKETLRAKKRALLGKGRITGLSSSTPAESAADLAGELEAQLLLDARAKIAKATTRLQRDLDRKCNLVDVTSARDALFPGVCSGVQDWVEFGSCAIEQTRCRFCESLSNADGLPLACDAFDNGAADGSCVTCGNGLVEFGETCDDANLLNGDGCSDLCQVEP